MNVIAIVGKVKELPVMHETPNGTKVCSLIMEVDRNFKNTDGIYEKDILQVTLWRGIAETTCNVAKVGSLISVKGRIQANVFETKEKNIFYGVDIIAEKLEFLQA